MLLQPMGSTSTPQGSDGVTIPGGSQEKGIVALREMISGHAEDGLELDLVILKGVSNHNDSVVL